MRYSKILPLFFLTTIIYATVNCQSKSKYYLLIGGYTKQTNDTGITVYEFNAKDGSLKYRSAIGGIDNPSYLTINDNGSRVYAVSEKGKVEGTVVSYNFDPLKGTLKIINEVRAGGKGPCYISTDANNKHVFVANYGDGNIAAIRLNKNGSLDSTGIQSIQHTGSSIDRDNQAGSYKLFYFHKSMFK